MDQRMNEFYELYEKAEHMPETYTAKNVRTYVKKKAGIHYLAAAGRNIGIACVVFFAIIVIGANTSQAFADSFERIPLLGNIVNALTWNRGYEDAVVSEYMTPVGIVSENEITDVELAYAMGDDNMLMLLLKAEDSSVDGIIDLVTINGTKDFSYSLGTIGSESPNSYGGYTVMEISWDEFCKDIDLKLKLQTYQGDSAELAYKFALQNKLEPKIYHTDKKVQAGDCSFTIGEVRIYPMSTQVDVYFDEGQTATPLSMHFEMWDEKNTVRENVSNFISAYYNENVTTYVLESGYFTFGDKVSLKLDKVELRSEDNRTVYFDVETEQFCETDGSPAEDIHIVSHTNDNEYEITIDGSPEWTYKNGLVSADENHMMGDRVTEDDTIVFIFWTDEYRQQDGKIYFQRDYPDIIVYPDVEIALE